MSVHQLEHEVSGMFDFVAHGAGLAVLWPAWAKFAYKASFTRFKRFAYEVMEIQPTHNEEQDVQKGIEGIKDFFKEIGMPSTLSELGVPEESLGNLAWNAMFKGKRTLKDIIEVDYDMALRILESAK